MKRGVKLLPQVHVASPCPAAWDEMAGDDRSRFCGECKMNVYNLSDMSADEAEAFLAEATGRVCVRYYRRADGKVMTRDCPRGLAAARKRFALSVTSAATVVLVLGYAVADGVRGGRDDEGRSRFAAVKDRLDTLEPFKTILDKIDPSRTQRVEAGAMVIQWNPSLFKPAPAPKVAMVKPSPVSKKRKNGSR
jgi:hypothetical protein